MTRRQKAIAVRRKKRGYPTIRLRFCISTKEGFRVVYSTEWLEKSLLSGGHGRSVRLKLEQCLVPREFKKLNLSAKDHFYTLEANPIVSPTYKDDLAPLGYIF